MIKLTFVRKHIVQKYKQETENLEDTNQEKSFTTF